MGPGGVGPRGGRGKRMSADDPNPLPWFKAWNAFLNSHRFKKWGATKQMTLMHALGAAGESIQPHGRPPGVRLVLDRNGEPMPASGLADRMGGTPAKHIYEAIAELVHEGVLGVYDSNLARTYPPPSPDLAGTWERPSPDLAKTWGEPGTDTWLAVETYANITGEHAAPRIGHSLSGPVFRQSESESQSERESHPYERGLFRSFIESRSRSVVDPVLWNLLNKVYDVGSQHWTGSNRWDGEGGLHIGQIIDQNLEYAGQAVEMHLFGDVQWSTLPVHLCDDPEWLEYKRKHTTMPQKHSNVGGIPIDAVLQSPQWRKPEVEDGGVDRTADAQHVARHARE